MERGKAMGLNKLTNYSVLQQFYSKLEEGRLNPYYPFFTLQWMNEPDQEEKLLTVMLLDLLSLS